MKTQNKTISLVTGYSCNNNCVFCFRKCSNFPKTDEPTKKLKSRIKTLYQKMHHLGYNTLELTGGEVTLRKDFLDLLSFARKTGFEKIRILTNGRKFKNKRFLEKAIASGLNSINFSLYSHHKKLQEKITQTPGSFDQTLEGIKNCLNYFPEIEVRIKTIVNKLNYRQLFSMGLFLNDLGIKKWILTELLPGGEPENSLKIYRKFVPDLKNLSFHFNRDLKRLTPLFNLITLTDFPPCLFKPEIFKIKNINLSNLLKEVNNFYIEISEVPYGGRIIKNKKLITEDSEKTKLGFCKKCKYFRKCSGITKSYFELFGDKDIRNLAKKYAKA